MKTLRLWVGLGVLLLALVGGMYALWYNNDYNRAARDLPNQLRAAKAEGMPLEPADLVRNPPVPPANNAAGTIRDVGREADAHQSDTAALERLTEPKVDWSRQLPVAKAAASRCKKLFALIDRAAAKTDCDFQIHSPVSRSDYEDLVGVLGGIEALIGRAELEARSSRSTDAWKSLQKAATISRLVGRTPGVFPLLIQQLTDWMVTDGVSRLLTAERASPQAVASARTVIKALGPLPDIRGMLRAELVANRAKVNEFRESVATPDRYNLPRGPLGLRSPFARTATARDAYDDRLIQAFRDVDHALAGSRDWDKVSGLLVRFRDLHGNARSSDAFVSAAFLTLVNIPNAVVEDVARRRLCLTAIRVYEFRNQYGTLPSSLANMGEDAIDPFTSRQLLYTRTDRTFQLASVGPNRTDDRGTRPTTASDDLTFGVPATLSGQQRILHH